MKRIFFIIIAVALIFASCNSNQLDVDVSDIQANIEVERFDQELYKCSDNISYSVVGELAEKYPLFFEIYNMHINLYPSP